MVSGVVLVLSKFWAFEMDRCRICTAWPCSFIYRSTARTLSSFGKRHGCGRRCRGSNHLFWPKEGGTIIVADITAVSLISHGGIRCWRFDECEKAALIIPVSAKGGEHLFDTFAEIDGFPLEQMLRQLADETIQTSFVWRRIVCGHDQKYLH